MSNALTLISLNSPLQFSIHFAGTWKPFRTTLPAFQDTILACNSNAPNRTTQLQHGLAQASINPRDSNETSLGFSQGFPTWWLNSPIVFPHPLASLSRRNQARLATRLAMRHPWHLPNLQPSHSKSQCLRGSGQSSMAAYLRCASKSSKDPLWSTWLCSILDQDNTKSFHSTFGLCCIKISACPESKFITVVWVLLAFLGVYVKVEWADI